MALTPGTRIGSYEVTAPLGVGGMGEVYRATDVKLGRAVAIEVLPESVAQDAPGSLRPGSPHAGGAEPPNIAAIYGVGGMRTGLLTEGDSVNLQRAAVHNAYVQPSGCRFWIGVIAPVASPAWIS